MLKFKDMKVIDCSDWDAFVKDSYQKEVYCLQQQDGCMDRGVVQLTVPSDYSFDYERTSLEGGCNDELMGVSLETWKNTRFSDLVDNFEHLFEAKLFWKRRFYPELETLANDLYEQGLLEAGDYMIHIDW